MPDHLRRHAEASSARYVVTKEESILDQHLPEEEAWLAERLAFEAAPENLIVVNPEPVRWHRALSATRKFLIHEDLKRTRATRDRDAYRARQALMLPITGWKKYPDEPSWSHLDNEPFLVPKRRISGFRVSQLTLDRALAIANALFVAADARGIRVNVEEPADRIQLELKGCVCFISIRERQTVEVIEHPGSPERAPDRKYHPADKLAVVGDGGTSTTEFEVVDGAEGRIDAQLNDVFRRFYSYVVRKAVRDRKWDRRQQQMDLERLQSALETKRRDRAAKAIAEEQARRTGLFDEAAAWQRANVVREYIRQLATATPAGIPPELKTWCDWATRVADETDPTVARLAMKAGTAHDTGAN